jgi:hypothetical protein
MRLTCFCLLCSRSEGESDSARRIKTEFLVQMQVQETDFVDLWLV